VLELRSFARAGRGCSACSLERGERFMAQRLCPNMNHRRRESPVAFCPECGEVVNQGIPPRSCSEESHAKQRRGRSHYCVDCREQLIRER
jgi:rRNA maturation protein Nop10